MVHVCSRHACNKNEVPPSLQYRTLLNCNWISRLSDWNGVLVTHGLSLTNRWCWWLQRMHLYRNALGFTKYLRYYWLQNELNTPDIYANVFISKLIFKINDTTNFQALLYWNSRIILFFRRLIFISLFWNWRQVLKMFIVVKMHEMETPTRGAFIHAIGYRVTLNSEPMGSARIPSGRVSNFKF